MSEDITLPLKEILDKGFPKPSKSKLITPGSYRYIKKNSKQIFDSSSDKFMLDNYEIGFFFDGPFLPIRNGACYTLYNLMRALSYSGKATPALLNCARGWDEFISYFDQEFASFLIGPADYYHNTGVISDIFQSTSMRIAQFYNGEILLNISPWLKKYGVKSILEIQNIEHVLLERTNAPREDIEKARHDQSAAIKAADFVFCRSEIDKTHAIELGAKSASIAIYKGGIYAKDFLYQPRSGKNRSLVYLGHLYYQPNEGALVYLIDKVMPHLPKDYQLTVIGSCPPYLVDKFASRKVIFKNGLDDISHELLKHDVAVAPIFAGSGTRLKLLDYLASGIPIITTKLGVEGLDPKISEYMTIEDDISAYPALVKSTISHPENYNERSSAGRRFVEKEYDWSKCVESFLDVYKELLNAS